MVVIFLYGIAFLINGGNIRKMIDKFVTQFQENYE